MATKKTAAQKRVQSAPASAFRKLSKTELVKLDLPAKSERYIEIGKRVSKNTTTISKRAFTTKLLGAGPEKLAAARAEGVYPYKSKASQAAAEKQRTTRALARKERFQQASYPPLTGKQIDIATKRFESGIGQIQTVRSERWAARATGRNGGTVAATYRLSGEMKGRLPDLYRRKLDGEHLPDGDWHVLADAASTAKDPMLARIMKS